MNVDPTRLQMPDVAPDRYADAEDFDVCRALHRKFGTTYYYASLWFPPSVRRNIHALYGFVRVPDEWVDNPQDGDLEAAQMHLAAYRAQLCNARAGNRPESPVIRAFSDVMTELNMDIEEPLLFLDAMKMDLSKRRYETYEELQGYMRGSAVAVGRMMCRVIGADDEPQVWQAADGLGEAMQLTNFLRDVGEDANRGRIYLPREDLDAFGVKEHEILAGKCSDRFVALMQFEIGRARLSYSLADQGIPLLPKEARRGVKLARILYSRILDRIEAAQYDVFRRRARTTRLEKLQVAAALYLPARK